MERNTLNRVLQRLGVEVFSSSIHIEGKRIRAQCTRENSIEADEDEADAGYIGDVDTKPG
jgi:hypothetical protein